MDEEFVFIWGVGKDLWVVKVYFMVLGVAVEVVYLFANKT